MPPAADHVQRRRVACVLGVATLLLALSTGPVFAGEAGSHSVHEHDAVEERALGVLHPMLVHLPLALSMVAALAVILGIPFRGPFFRSAATYSIVLGAMSSIPAFLLGQEAGSAMGRMSESREATVSIHETWGRIAMLVLLGAAAIHLLSTWRSSSTPLRWLSRVSILGAAGILAHTGYLGGEVARGPGHLDALLPW
ncbi:MAG: DUF2231 domain-containing protein [Planctomycetota bacterium]|jgi:uncharacterized membrane protein